MRAQPIQSVAVTSVDGVGPVFFVAGESAAVALTVPQLLACLNLAVKWKAIRIDGARVSELKAPAAASAPVVVDLAPLAQAVRELPDALADAIERLIPTGSTTVVEARSSAGIERTRTEWTR